MNSKVLLILLSILSPLILKAQNLVENPSFENVTGTLKCSWYISETEFNSAISGWTCPSGGSTDIFSTTLATTCYCSPFSTNTSSPGQQAPRTGERMVNITVFGDGGCDPYREYIQGHLTTPLVAGQTYLVEYYVSFADNGTYATDNLGMYFTTSAFFDPSMCVLSSLTPQLNYTGPPITDMTNWTLVSFTYTPTAGGLEYFTMGNFYSDVNTNTTFVGGPNGTIRYFVDDVSITPMSTTPTSDFTVVTPLCLGNATTVTYTGTGTGSATYNWNFDGGTIVSGSGQGPYQISWPGAGTYNISLDVTEGGNTSGVTTHQVVINPSPTADFTAESPICISNTSTITYTGSASGSATYTWNFDGGSVVSGSGQGPYEISWSTAGSYNVSLQVSENGCIATFNINIKVNDLPTSTFITDSPACIGENVQVTYTGNSDATGIYNWNFDGASVVSGSGAGPYLIFWNTAGTYNLSLTVDQDGCVSSVSNQSVTINQAPTSSFTMSAVDCYAGTSTYTYTGNAGAGATYTWDYGTGTPVGPDQVTWATSGNQTISLEVTENGCTSSVSSESVTVPEELIITVSTSNVSCFSGSNGSVSTTVTGGTPTYAYAWSNGTGDNFDAGTYQVTVTDANSCTAETSFDILQPTSLAWTTNSTDPGCNGGSDGSASITVNDGTPPYSYAWSSGGTSATENGLSAGTYSVTIIDDNQCELYESVTVNEPSLLSAAISSVTEPSCYTYCDGTATGSGSGGTAPYTYIWSTGSIQSTAIVCAGNHTLTITDNNLCIATVTADVDQPTQVNANINTTTDVSCFGYCNGTANVIATGGNAPYNYAWSAGGNSQSIVNLCPGTVIVSVTDANACTDTISTIINEPTALNISVNINNEVSCYQLCDGSATVTVTGGSGSYSYSWSNSETAVTAFSLCAGTHNITITDTETCSSSTDVTITEPDELTSTVQGVAFNTCYGDCNASINAIPAGGTSPYSGSWSNGSMGLTATNLCVGDYIVTITDNNSCTTTTSAYIDHPQAVEVIINGSETLCYGQSTTVSAVATGGNGAPYSYVWTNMIQEVVSTDQVLATSPTGTISYSVFATDYLGCESSDTNTIIQVLEPLTLDIFSDDTLICPNDEATINFSMTGGVGMYYLYLVDDFDFTMFIPPYIESFEETDTLYFKITDGCSTPVTEEIIIEIMPTPVVDFNADLLSGCEPHTVQFYYPNAQPDETYIWNFGDYINSSISIEAEPEYEFSYDGIFDVTLEVTSANGCKTILPKEDFITVYPNPNADFYADPASQSYLDPSFQFYNQSTGYDELLWSFDDGYYSTETDPPHTYFIDVLEYSDFDFPLQYSVSLLTTTNDGCIDSDTLIIKVIDEPTFYAPTAFVPDGQNSKNQIFNVFGVGIDETSFHMIIFDRWGEKVFETYNLHKGWDGRIKNRQLAPVGVYSWLVNYKDSISNSHIESGSVTVIR